MHGELPYNLAASSARRIQEPSDQADLLEGDLAFGNVQHSPVTKRPVPLHLYQNNVPTGHHPLDRLLIDPLVRRSSWVDVRQRSISEPLCI